MQRHILFFNATYIKKELTLSTAKDLGLTVSVIGPKLPDWSKQYVDHFIEADTYDIEQTLSVLRKYHEERPFDGVITFWDRDVEPVAHVASEFNLPGSSKKAAARARNKSLMRDVLKLRNVPHPKFIRISGSWDELERAAEEVGYPLIYKPVGASASKGVFKVESVDQLRPTWEKMMQFATPETDKMFAFYRDEYLVEEFMSGKEVSVEGVVAKGKIHIAGITEKWADHLNFTEYQHAFPARLPEKVVQELYEVTRLGVEALELDNCGFHAELIITEQGSKIVEIAGRLGGDFITTHLIPMAYGSDITRANILAVLGEDLDLTPKKKRGACIRFILAEKEGVVREWIGTENVMNRPGVVHFAFDKQVGDTIVMPPNKFMDFRLCYVIVEGEDTDDAIRKAEQALANVRCVIE
ncbi:ATP-grasp domain-containing protein [Paenibacillus alvei]|uniref:ATP-grasp domain-containing protein n=1 Tax=Paenibacillus alvei TaxID=44250 RepID=A0AAP7DLI6_PAEAL|nr:ATP-grasp domain-containing protein [Paenibacillus alvei]NOJ73791.1 ATP-grasp domain-containing protein [Paenibacillus alvei]